MAVTVSTRRRPSAAAVLRLYRFAPWARHRGLSDTASMLKHSPLLATAWDGRALVGFARCGTDFTYRAVIWDVIVDPSYARRGLGTRLVRGLLTHPRLRKVESFWLSTTDKQPFYETLGFSLNKKNIMVRKRPA